MKLSELTYREYIALEILPKFAGQMLDKEAVRRSFGIADAFLKYAGYENYKVKSLESKCQSLEIQNNILLNMNSDGQFSARVALLQIWEMLGDADNQTLAVQRLRDLQERAAK